MRARVQYGDPLVLAAVGPLLKAVWSVPAALAEELQKARRPIPPPVRGFMLVDTGATRTAIASDVAQELQLGLVRYVPSFGVGGLHNNPVYQPVLQMSFADEAGRVSSVSAEDQFAAVPRLDEAFQMVAARTKLTVADDFPKRLTGLLGRDFLRYGTAIYDGHNGAFEITLSPESFK